MTNGMPQMGHMMQQHAAKLSSVLQCSGIQVGENA